MTQQARHIIKRDTSRQLPYGEGFFEPVGATIADTYALSPRLGPDYLI